MGIKNSKLLFLVVSLLILLIVLGFSGSLYVSFFNNNYMKSVVASNSVAGGEVVRKIEYAMKYGKPLTNFYGIEEMLVEMKQGSPLIQDVRIVLPDGTVLYGIPGGSQVQHIGAKLTHAADFSVNGEREKYRIVSEDGKYEVFMPIKGRQGFVGSLTITFDEHSIAARTTGAINQTVEAIVIIALLVALCLVVAIYFLPIINADGTVRRKPFIIVLLLVLGLAQVISGVHNIIIFKDFYVDVAQKNTVVAAQFIQKNVESVNRKGVAYGELYHIEEWLQQIIETVPEIEGITIKSDSLGVLYESSSSRSREETIVNWGPLAQAKYQIPLVTDSTGQDFSLSVTLSTKYIESKIKKIALEALTVLIVSLLTMVELILFLVQVLHNKTRDTVAQYSGVNFLVIRPLAFIFFVAWAMSISFIPLMMLELYQPFWGLSEGVAVGLPVSMEAFTTIFSTVVTGYLIDRRGWKPSFVYGVLIFAAGTLLSAFTRSEEIFILSRAITGIGYGFAWMSLRGFAAMAPMGDGKTMAFAGLNAGIYAGINCGVVLGAMLAEQMGFSKVFMLSAVLALVTSVVTYLFTNNLIISNATAPAKGQQALRDTWRNLKAVCQDPKILSFFLLIAIPSSIFLMFLDYCIPVLAKNAQVDSADVGWAFLLYGLCVVYLGPYLAKFVGKQNSLKKAMLLSNLICVLGLLIFTMIGSYASAIVAVILLGISSSFGFVAKNNYLLSLESVKMLGAATTLGLYGVVNKLGQVIGPIIFGAFSVFGMAKGVGMVSVLLFILLVVFVVISRNGKNSEQSKVGVKI